MKKQTKNAKIPDFFFTAFIITHLVRAVKGFEKNSLSKV